MPLFVREGAIVPMLLTEVRTLCDANYVNNPTVKTPDSGLLFLVYPGGTSTFSVYDGTEIRCDTAGGTSTVTLSSAARLVVLQIFAEEPAAISRDGVVVSKLATLAEFESSDTGWRADPQSRFIFVKFQHLGGTTKVNF